MVGTATLDKLSAANISKDADKTKERVDVLWKSSTKAQKESLKTFADSKSDRAFYNITKDGIITARKALALAQTFAVSPYYLTAETDEPGDSSDDVLKTFVKQYTLKKQSAKAAAKKPKDAPKKERKKREPKVVSAVPANSEVSAAPTATSRKPATKVKTPTAKKAAAPKKTAQTKPAKAPRTPKIAADTIPSVNISDVNLTLDEMQSLLSTAFIRANNGIGGAKDKLEQIKALLLL
jgi:hypothetical protein